MSVSADAGAGDDVGPGRRLDGLAVVVESVRVLGDETLVEHTGVGVGLLQHRLGHAAHEGQVAADTDLDVEVPVRVVWKVPMSTNSCGTIVRRDAASISGLMWTNAAPRRSASASQVSMRGAFVAALSPISQIASACSQSLRSVVPLPVPMAAVSARPLASWHMLEQSGMLFVPNSRTHS